MATRAPDLVCPPSACMGVFSGVVLRSPFATTLLNADRVLPYPSDEQAHGLDAVVGWGLKPGAEQARAYAVRHQVRFLRAEDAFLRSVRLGVQGEAPIGICLDDRGMYYDARHPSRLEDLIRRSGTSDEIDARAQACVHEIRTHGLSKYNWWPSEQVPWRDDRRRVLVVDQTAGDLSIKRGLATAASFETMLDDALEAHPDAEIVVKVHPDVLSGHKQGHLEHVRGEHRVRLLAEPVHPVRLLEHVDEVYAVTSQLGFEALLVGKPVHCYGMPFYAGWGLTQDALVCERRSVTRSLSQVFHAAYVDYARYAHPETGTECQVEDVIDHLAWLRGAFARNAGSHVVVGMPRSMRSAHRAALTGPRSEVHHARKADRRPGTRIWCPSPEATTPVGPPHRRVGPGPLDALLPPAAPMPASFTLSAPPSPEYVPGDPDAQAACALRLLREWATSVPARRLPTHAPFVLFLGRTDPRGRSAMEGDLRALHASSRAGVQVVYARPPGYRLPLRARCALARLHVRVVPTDGYLPGWIMSATRVETRSAMSALWIPIMGREPISPPPPWLPPHPPRTDPELAMLLRRLLVDGSVYTSFRTGYPCSCEAAIRERLARARATPSPLE